MLNRYLKLAIVIVALGGAIEASGQQATEMFIPIGQSPGLSNKESVIGTLESVDQGKQMVTISSSSGASLRAGGCMRQFRGTSTTLADFAGRGRR